MSSSRIQIDPARCTRCGRCVRTCPASLWQLDEDAAAATPIAEAETLCVACGHCAAACPGGAISINGVHPAKMEPCLGELPAPADFRRLVQRRRSIRLYQSRPVPRSEIESLIEVTRWAPTARNAQQVYWTVVRDPVRMRELAATIVTFFRANDRLPGVVAAWDKGIDRVLRGAPHLVVVHSPAEAIMPVVDCTIALTTFSLAATAAGIGTCWAGYFMWAAAGDPAPLARILALPAGHTMHGALMLGYSLAAYLRVPARDLARMRWLDAAPPPAGT